ncbi:MAG TPA: archaellum operon transcriptional activator EarA family protein [Candidatus Thermoplasmatota archaeon]|nr:archaellum operon transcriptional activator EarA family protein [Candidatus Thermoplasmatota archaeon]
MTDPVARALAAFSSRRSASRSRLIVALDKSENGAMLARELAHECGMDAGRLQQVMFGDGVDFSTERSPIALGQVTTRETPHGLLYEITPAGRDEARRLQREAFWERGRGRRR